MDQVARARSRGASLQCSGIAAKTEAADRGENDEAAALSADDALPGCNRDGCTRLPGRKSSCAPGDPEVFHGSTLHSPANPNRAPSLKDSGPARLRRHRCCVRDRIRRRPPGGFHSPKLLDASQRRQMRQRAPKIHQTVVPTPARSHAHAAAHQFPLFSVRGRRHRLHNRAFGRRLPAHALHHSRFSCAPSCCSSRFAGSCSWPSCVRASVCAGRRAPLTTAATASVFIASVAS